MKNFEGIVISVGLIVLSYVCAVHSGTGATGGETWFGFFAFIFGIAGVAMGVIAVARYIGNFN